MPLDNLLTNLHVLIVGTGSIAKRHIEVLHSLGVERAEYFSRSGRQMQTEDLSLVSVSFERAKSARYDLVVICSKTQAHAADIETFSDRGEVLLVEKPLTNSLEALDGLVAQGCLGPRLFVSFPWRFKDALVFLRYEIRKNAEDVSSLSSVNRSWLPDWRAGRVANDGYWNETESGGVALELIHEFDLVELLFGPMLELEVRDTSTGVLGMNVSESIDAHALGAHGENLAIHLDFCSRESIRLIRAVSASHSWAWDLLSSSVEINSLTGMEKSEFPADRDRNESFRRQYLDILKLRPFPVGACAALEAETLNRKLLTALETTR